MMIGLALLLLGNNFAVPGTFFLYRSCFGYYWIGFGYFREQIKGIADSNLSTYREPRLICVILFICGKINDTFCCCYANSRISNSPRAAFVSHEIRCPYGRTAFLNFGRIDDHHLHALPEVVCHPFFPFARRDGILHDLGADAGVREEAF